MPIGSSAEQLRSVRRGGPARRRGGATVATVSDDILDEIAAGTSRPSQSYPFVEACLELAVLHRPTGNRGRINRFTGEVVELRDSRGAKHAFRNRPGAFAVNGETVTLVAARTEQAPRTRVSAAGGIVATEQAARVARASRLWVEGTHDAQLLERVWGDELRELGVVVEALGGLDDLIADIERFGPGPGRTLVVLADHLVAGSKEQRIADAVTSSHVRVVGHPYVDVWQCVRPASVGIEVWPEIPMGTDWKTGICDSLGWGTPSQGWRRVLASVDSFADLDPTLVNAIESALDHFAGEAESMEARS